MYGGIEIIAEYIDRESLLKVLKLSREWHAETERDFSLLVRCENIVREQPAEDVAPVRHGRWIPYQTPIETGKIGWICNQCSGVVRDVSNGDTDYCPNCGAKMDGGICEAD